MPDLSEKIKFVIARQLEIKAEAVVSDAKIIEDLGADSLDIIDLFSMIEEEFGIQIPGEDDNKITTVGDLVEYIEERSE